ncbi:peptidyl-prolyl cis-trans isomerase D [Diprion similis]|uniref:peptidyl-prolyl cis-trans isomerase D n=1 Tax=Diprion similis TaxID=362088 RepID=UPI001EF826D7|nr:peptidyl-prolyl cis-trans isomerase D [Diprion similis]
MKRPLEDQDNGYEKNPIVFLDIAIEGERVGRIVLELFKHLVPRTAENFRALCTGEKGIGMNGKPLHYKGSIFHKVVPQCMIQGGDIINFDGSGGESIYGSNFEDESFEYKSIEQGCLVMVNEGSRNSNSSQFVITAVPCPHLDETNVAFGKVLKGMGVVLEVNQVETIKDVPQKKIRIVNCGELKRGESWGLEERDNTEDVFPSWPEDWDLDSTADKMDMFCIEEVVKKIKDSGNHYFSEKDYATAERKYTKALRYIDWGMKLNNSTEKPSENGAGELRVAILSNLVAVKLKRDQCREALKICNKILNIDRNNCKAMYRRGLAHMGLNEYQLALTDMKQALEEMPNNKEIIQKMEKVNKIIQSYLVYEKEICLKMFK